MPGIRYVVDTGVARISPLLGAAPRCSGCRSRRSARPRPTSAPAAAAGVEAGHRDPALLRGGLRGPPGVHRPRDPAHQPGLGHPPDDLARARRHRPVPVRRAARPAQRHRRRPAARGARCPGRDDGSTGDEAARADPGRPAAGPAADRPAAGPDDPRGRAARLRARGPRHRRGAVAAGPARAARSSSRRRPTSCTPASRTRGRDFLTWLNLWRHLAAQQRELSSSAFRRMCKREYLNYLRVREWQDFESQLRQVCREMKVDARASPADVPDADGIHQALLSGLLSHIGAARGAREGDAGRAAARPAGVPRRPRRAVRDLPRQRAAREEPGVPDGRRAGRDRPAVGPAERRDQARVGRAARRAPGEAHLQRAALVEEAGRGDGLRAGHAVRRPAGRRPARAATAGSTAS